MPEKTMMQLWAWAFSYSWIYLLGSRLARWGQFVLARSGWIRKVPVYPASQWTAWRDVPAAEEVLPRPVEGDLVQCRMRIGCTTLCAEKSINACLIAGISCW